MASRHKRAALALVRIAGKRIPRALLLSRAKEILIIYKNTQRKSLMSVGAARLLSPVTLLSRAPERARSQKVFNSALILRAVVSAAKTRRRRQLSYIPAAKVPDAGRVSFCEDAPVVAFSKVSPPGTWKAEMSGGGKSSSPICICARESFFLGRKGTFLCGTSTFYCVCWEGFVAQFIISLARIIVMKKRGKGSNCFWFIIENIG